MRARDRAAKNARRKFVMSRRLTPLKSNMAAVALTALTLTACVTASSQRADAKGPRIELGMAAGLTGAVTVALANGGSDVDGREGDRRCGWIRQYDAYGNYLGRVRVCGS
jgi:hypothetical protein